MAASAWRSGSEATNASASVSARVGSSWRYVTVSTGANGSLPGMESSAATKPDRNLALELVRVTEAAALTAARMIGRGDKEGADQAAVDAMRHVLDSVSFDGVVVIGEGEKDEAPMLYNGEHIG